VKDKGDQIARSSSSTMDPLTMLLQKMNYDQVARGMCNIREKFREFNGANITQYLKAYQRELEVFSIKDAEMIANFYKVVDDELRTKVRLL
jgi:hypothetical protein